MRLMAEFADGAALRAGLQALAAGGVTRLDAFTPYEVEGIDPLIRAAPSRLPWIVLAAAICGGAGAYLLQWWINVVDYPINAGGRPDHAALAFVPITFEMTVLCAGAAALIAAIVMGGLPRLWHPVFEVEGFESATRDGFWLAAGDDPALDRARDTAALEAAGARRVVWLPAVVT